MLFPMSKSAPDAEAGGPLVQAMRGGNSLANDMLLKKINEAKALYAPQTEFANAASKLAYSNFLAPQTMAKFLNNPAIAGSMTQKQYDQIMSMVNGAASNYNNLRQLPQIQAQPPNNKNNSFGGWALGTLKNLFQPRQLQVPVQMQPNAPQQDISQQNFGRPSGGSVAAPLETEAQPTASAPLVEGKDYDNNEALDAYHKWMKSPEGIKELSKNENANIPDDQQVVAWSRKQNGAQGVPNENSTQPPSSDSDSGLSFAEKAARYKGILKEGEVLGDLRGKSIEDLDKQYQQAVQAEVPLKHMNQIVSNPIFQKLRSLPGVQNLQLLGKETFGNAAEQKLIGDFRATALNAVAQTVMGFGGRILASEIQLANDMKINPKDNFNVILGKLPSIETFNEMTKQRSRMAAKLQEQYHLNRGDALERADKMVNGAAIRKKVEQELDPINDEDIDSTAKKYGMTRDQVIQKLKVAGRYHG